MIRMNSSAPKPAGARGGAPANQARRPGAVRVLLLYAMVATARAQTGDRPLSADAILPLALPFEMRFDSGVSAWPAPSPGTASSVLTPDYQSRMLDERIRQEFRFGLHVADQAALRLHALHRTPVPSYPRLSFVQELSWPGSRPLTGLQFERKGLLFVGDQVSIRSTSDVQALLRGIGLSGSEVDLMSLLGRRSRTQLL